MSNADMTGTIPSETFHQQLSLKLMTEDCKLLLAQVIHVLRGRKIHKSLIIAVLFSLKSAIS